MQLYLSNEVTLIYQSVNWDLFVSGFDTSSPWKLTKCQSDRSGYSVLITFKGHHSKIEVTTSEAELFSELNIFVGICAKHDYCDQL